MFQSSVYVLGGGGGNIDGGEAALFPHAHRGCIDNLHRGLVNRLSISGSKKRYVPPDLSPNAHPKKQSVSVSVSSQSLIVTRRLLECPGLRCANWRTISAHWAYLQNATE